MKGSYVEFDAVIYLTGKAHNTKNQTVVDINFKVETGLTQRICDWFFEQSTCPKFVFLRTAKAAVDR